MLSYQYNNVAHRCRWMDEGGVVSPIQPKVMPETVKRKQTSGQTNNERLFDLRALHACWSVCPGCPVSCTVFRHELAQEAGLCPRQGARRADGGAERARPHPPRQNIAICCCLMGWIDPAPIHLQKKLRHFSTYSEILRVDTACRGAPTGVFLTTGGGVPGRTRITY